ncbi:MAG TPA: ABC transporter permease [Gemmatimonadales bacterium]|nr:ABC transporter permease [Gemmatimonadales bacterium]
MDGLLRSLRIALRSLRRRPSLTASIVLTLALCIGGTAAVFGAVYAVLFRPLPWARPDGVLVVRELWRAQQGSMSVGNWADLRRRDRLFEHLVPTYPEQLNLAGLDQPENVPAARVGPDYFQLLGVSPALGRTFASDEDTPGRDQVVVLSDGLWRRRFGADRSVIGREVRLDGRPATVIGVMPASLDFTLLGEQLWIPTAFTPEQLAQHDEHFLTVLGRLRPGVTPAEARTELADIARGLEQEFPRENQERGLGAFSLMEELVQDYRPRLFVLLGAVGFVLLIACANIGNLLLAQGTARGREMAIRAAVGAGRGHLLRQALTENLLLAGLGGALGVLVAHWAIQGLTAFGPADVPRLAQARVDGPMLGFVLAVTLGAGLLFGLAPALRLASRPPHAALKEGRSGGVHRDRLRSALVVTEIALALMLLTGAGLLIRSAAALNRVQPGYDPTGVVAARVSLPTTGYETPDQARTAFERLADQISAVRGVTASGVASVAPLEGGNTNGLVPEGRPLDVASSINSYLRIVSPGYLGAMRIPLRRGRGFTDQDRKGTPLVMIINERLAREAFPGQDPIGKRIACCDGGPDGLPGWKTVVGVVADVRAQDMSQPAEPEFYLPLGQAPEPAWNWIQRSMTVAARGTGGPMALVPGLREAVRAVDPAVPLYQVGTMDDRITRSLAQARFSTALLTAFGAMALLLAAIGVFGVISYGVSQRTQEIGVRVALGADRGDVVRLIVRHGARLAALGLLIGLGGALVASRLLGTLLYQVSPTDPPTFLAGAAVLGACAIAAAALPALRAARLDPAIALRAE